MSNLNLIYSVTTAEPTPPGHSDATFSNVTTVVWLLIAIGVVAILTKYIKVPYPIALVLAGVAIALTPGVPTVVLTPDLIVLAFLPVLLFEAAYNLSFKELRENIRFISTLAIWGVLGTAAIVAGLLIWLGGLSWQTALLFGSIVAATDPVSVVATFRQLGAPKRLSVMVEGESLFNDGSALVLFNLLVEIIVMEKFDFWTSLVEFVRVSAGGLLVGIAVGYLALGLLSRFDDYLTETLVTIIAAYGVFLIAEQISVSPALAVVAAGLLMGNFGQSRVFSPTSRVAVGLSWELFGFLANSLIFLLVGLEVRAIDFSNYWGLMALAVSVTLFSRIVVISFFSNLTNFLRKKKVIPFSWQTIMIWGGLRGALSLALALSLPLTLASGQPFPDRDRLLVITFGLILFTLIVQGLTVEPLLRFFKLGLDKSEQLRQYEELQGRLTMARAAQRTLQNLHRNSLLDETTIHGLMKDYAEREKQAEKGLDALHLSNELLKEKQLRGYRRQILQVEKSAVRDLFNQGAISDEVMRELWSEIDDQLNQLDLPHTEEAEEAESEQSPPLARPVD